MCFLLCFLLSLSYIKWITYSWSVVIYPIIIMVIFIYNNIHFMSKKITQTSWCHRLIVFVFYRVILRHNNFKIFCIVYECVIEFCLLQPRWSIIIESIYSISIISACSSYFRFCPQHMHHNIATEIWSQRRSFESYIFIDKILSS